MKGLRDFDKKIRHSEKVFVSKIMIGNRFPIVEKYTHY